MVYILICVSKLLQSIHEFFYEKRKYFNLLICKVQNWNKSLTQVLYALTFKNDVIGLKYVKM